MMDSCSGGQVGGVCAVGARLQGGEGLQGVAPGGDRAQPGGRGLCLNCPLPAQLLPQVSENNENSLFILLCIPARPIEVTVYWVLVLHSRNMGC